MSAKDFEDAIFTTTFLDSIAPTCDPINSTVCYIAQNRAEFSTYLDQVNTMWKALPNNAKQKLAKMLRNSKDGNFRGAFGNLVAHSVLSRYSKNAEYDPLIGTFTPDFRVNAKNGEYIFEAFCLGRDQDEHLQNKKLKLLSKELSSFSSKRKIWLKGNAIPNPKTGFEGIGKFIHEYVEQVDLKKFESNHIHLIKYENAHVFFRIQQLEEECSLFGGWQENGAYGNPQVDLLNTELKERIDKYTFPFSAVCILDSTVWGAVYTLLETMLGKLVYQVPIDLLGTGKERGPVTTGIDQTGFWGIRNPELERNSIVQSVLFVSMKWNPDENHKLSAELLLMENPNKTWGLTEIFHDVPNVLQVSDDPLKTKGLHLEL
jgi:hypothetical protein